ncbi:glycoside hydrolase family 51 protein [Cenococcum geophilum]
MHVLYLLIIIIRPHFAWLGSLGWVEYCTSSSNTYYANLRWQNGREKPYNVRYWTLGNEMWGPWQVGQTTKEDYAKKVYQWAKALKLLEPSIELVLSYVLKECIKWDVHSLGGSTTASLISMHSTHIYAAAAEHLLNATGNSKISRESHRITADLIDLARIENQVPHTIPRQTICFDEWKAWDPARAPGDKGAEEKYTVSDALAVGVWLNVFIRQSKYIGMANIAQSINVISLLMTTEFDIVKQMMW